MDKLLIQMIELADKLDKKNAKKAAEMLDSCIKTAGLIKQAQYVGVQGYWLKQERSFINCYNAKRRKSSGKTSPQECFFDCLDEYQEAMVGSVETDSWSKYAQISPSTAGQGDSIQGLNTGTVAGHVATGKEIIDKLEKIQEKRKANTGDVKVANVKAFFKEARQYETEVYIDKMYNKLREGLVQVGDFLDRQSMLEDGERITKIASMTKEAQWYRSLWRNIDNWFKGSGLFMGPTGKRIKQRMERIIQDANKWFAQLKTGTNSPEALQAIENSSQQFMNSISALTKIKLPVAEGKGDKNQEKGQQQQQKGPGLIERVKDTAKGWADKAVLKSPTPATASSKNKLEKKALFGREPYRIYQDLLTEIQGLYSDIGQLGSETPQGREKLPEIQQALTNMLTSIKGTQEVAMRDAAPDQAEAVAAEEAQETPQEVIQNATPEQQQMANRQMLQINELLTANPGIVNEFLTLLQGRVSTQQKPAVTPRTAPVAGV